jgi:hypothetical protein
MKKNLIITYLHGNNCLHMLESEIYLHSLSKLKNCEKAIFINGVDSSHIETLKKFYDIIIPDNEVNPEIAHLSIYKWLCKHIDEYDYVLNTDLRDVIFQRDPFEFFKNNPDKKMFFTLEGMKIKENLCNTTWHQWYKNNIRFHTEDYLDSFVINGGVWGGKIDHVMNFCLFIFSQVNMISRSQIVNQQSMGYFYKFWKDNPEIMLCHPNSDDFCATGEAIKWGNVYTRFDGKQVLNLKNQPYYIFHQWDRTEFADSIRNNFKNTLSFVI